MIPDLAPRQDVETNGRTCKKCDFSCVDAFPLSMAYVPMQKFENIYELEKGFDTGTIFAALDQPFIGYMKRGGGIN